MWRPVVAFFLLMTASAGLADENARRPDYSPLALLRLFNDGGAVASRGFDHRAGALDFTTGSSHTRFVYLPFLAPFPGSVRRTDASLPDPFALTGMVIPHTARTWRSAREFNRERRRIERMERERAQMRVTMQ